MFMYSGNWKNAKKEPQMHSTFKLYLDNGSIYTIHLEDKDTLFIRDNKVYHKIGTFKKQCLGKIIGVK